jgi:glucokinase
MQNVFAGVDVGGTRIKIGLTDTSGHLVSYEIVKTASCLDAESFLEIVAGKIRTLANAASVLVAAAGIGCPGRIDYTSGTVLWLKSKLEFLDGVPLAKRLSDRLECPVVCDNDVNTILAGEMRYGAGRGHRNVIAVTVGTGIGGAIVLGGCMVRGHNWAAGHFGFMSHDPQGPQHVCGNAGIFEEHASQSGIQRQVRRAFEAGEASQLTGRLADGDEPGMHELFQAVDAGDPLGCRLAEHLTSELGVLIANLIYALDPELVLVGGGIMNHRPSIFGAVRREAAERLKYLPLGATKILPMELGDIAGILGGATLAMDAINQTEPGQCALGEKL